MRHTGDKRWKKAELQARRGSVRTDGDGTLGNHGAVGLVDDAIDLLEVIRVRDDLVVGDEVLYKNLRGQFWLFFSSSPNGETKAGDEQQMQSRRTNLVDKHGCGCE
jgi:hypothetical protein